MVQRRAVILSLRSCRSFWGLQFFYLRFHLQYVRDRCFCLYARVELSIVTIMMMFVSTRVINLFTEGLDRRKSFLIVFDYKDLIAEAIINDIGRGVTVFNAYGYYSKLTHDALLCDRQQLSGPSLQRVISNIDPKALVVISNVQSVTGQGFTFFNKNNRNDKFYLK